MKRAKNGHGSKECFASNYAKEIDPGEDWAESLAAYRYNSNKFRERCLGKYTFLKEAVYKNQEYFSEGSCPVLKSSEGSPVPVSFEENYL